METNVLIDILYELIAVETEENFIIDSDQYENAIFVKTYDNSEFLINITKLKKKFVIHINEPQI
ncbi:MAG: hypothetical protein RR327_07610 [Clostridia bacterium]